MVQVDDKNNGHARLRNRAAKLFRNSVAVYGAEQAAPLVTPNSILGRCAKSSTVPILFVRSRGWPFPRINIEIWGRRGRPFSAARVLNIICCLPMSPSHAHYFCPPTVVIPHAVVNCKAHGGCSARQLRRRRRAGLREDAADVEKKHCRNQACTKKRVCPIKRTLCACDAHAVGTQYQVLSFICDPTSAMCTVP